MDSETSELILALDKRVNDLWDALHGYQAAVDVLLARLLAKVPEAEVEEWITTDTEYQLTQMDPEYAATPGGRQYAALFKRLPERIHRYRSR